LGTLNNTNYTFNLVNGIMTVTGSSTSSIVAISVSNGAIRITWNSTVGKTYRVQYVNNLNSTNWSVLGPDITATNLVTSATDSILNSPQRFYRVLVVAATQPLITSITVVGGVATITWNSVSGTTYNLEYTDSLTSVGWTSAPAVTATGPTTLQTNSVGTSASRYYRVMVASP
jgi:hypothetical protein